MFNIKNKHVDCFRAFSGLILLLSMIQPYRADYVINVLLAEFKNPSGVMATGAYCDTFYWSGKDDCDMSFKFCVETAKQITDNITSCSTGWYNFGQITANSNFATFQADETYGGFYNGEGFTVLGNYSLNVPLFQLKMQIKDVDQYGSEMIDQFSTTVTPQNIYEASGSFVKYEHHRPNLDRSADTQLIFYYQVRNGSGPLPTSVSTTTEAQRSTTSLVCQNGGTPNLNGIDCLCPPLFSGRFCQTAPRRNCYDLFKYYGNTGEGLFTINLNGTNVQVYCDNGWTLFQRRINDGISFNRTWNEYQQGFGNLNGGSFWLGNDKIFLLTNSEQTMSMRAELWDCNSPTPNTAYQLYRTFKIEDESQKYRIHASSEGTEGNAGDALNQVSFGVSDNNQQFSTPDGNDNDAFSGDCAKIFAGGWWYSSCGSATLNGLYHDGCNYPLPTDDPLRQYFGDGILWETWYKNVAYSLARTEMKIRPNDVQI